MKKRWILFGFLLMVLLANACGPKANPEVPPAPVPKAWEPTKDNFFECTLEAEEAYVMGEPVNLRFSLHNKTDRTLYILTWYTPLEGIAGKIFRVMHDGGEVPYRGIMAKRGDPSRDAYTAIKPGAAVSSVVDLAENYDLSQAGRYHVEFTSRLHDVTDDESSIPRKQDDHKVQELPCNTVSFEIVH
jgi:hypothetical protein